MRQTKEQSWFRHFFLSKLFLVVGFIIVGMIAFGYARAYYQDYRIKQEIKELQEEIKNLETKKIESLEILKYVTSNDFVEEKARTELNMRNPGENLVIIDRDSTDFEKNSQTQNNKSEPLKNYMKWWYYFTHKTI